jgi:hypothetical protein
MDAPTDPAKLRAALEHLEAVQAQRVAEKIAAGEVISVDLYIVAGSQSSARTQVEEAKANKLKELHDAGDMREVVFTVNVVITGVCQFGEAADPASVPSAPGFSREDVVVRPSLPRAARAPAPSDDGGGASVPEQEAPQPPVIESYICVQTRRCHDDDDPGEIAEGWFSIDGKVVTVTNKSGGYVGSRTMLKGEDARVVAKALLREKNPENETFHRRLNYPGMGLA